MAGARGPKQSAAVRSLLSAGGVVCRRGRELEVVLVATADPRRPGRLRWGLPKGLVAPGETHEAAALREVREETGLAARILAPLEPEDYWYWGQEDGQRVRYHKRVDFFLMAAEGGDTRQHDWEVVDAAWFSWPEAAAAASFAGERAVLEQARRLLDALSPPPGSPGRAADPGA